MKLTKLKMVGTCFVAIACGLISQAHASGVYFPPEHIQCQTADSKLSCSNFNRQYLVEYTHATNLEHTTLFSFISGAAYSGSQEEWTVFFTYKDPNQKNVTLKSINNGIKPSFTNGAWAELADGIYTCDAGYRSCQLAV